LIAWVGLFVLAAVGAMPKKLFVATAKELYISMALTYFAQKCNVCKIV
jgi:hypothetical protein